MKFEKTVTKRVISEKYGDGRNAAHVEFIYNYCINGKIIHTSVKRDPVIFNNTSHAAAYAKCIVKPSKFAYVYLGSDYMYRMYTVFDDALQKKHKVYADIANTKDEQCELYAKTSNAHNFYNYKSVSPYNDSCRYTDANSFVGELDRQLNHMIKNAEEKRRQNRLQETVISKDVKVIEIDDNDDVNIKEIPSFIDKERVKLVNEEIARTVDYLATLKKLL